MSAIYIQHIHNPFYYYGDDRWLLGRDRARQFSDARAAIAFCLENNVVYAQVHVCFGPGAADVVVPVTRDSRVAPALTEAVVW